ncbi:MAG: VWA domain-containing protein [Vicinamibacterales bacterium]
MRRALSVVAAVLLVVVSAPLSAQTVFRGGVELVEIDVNVVDPKDQPIADLATGEFTVKVDGKPRRILSAEYVTAGPSPSAAPGARTGDAAAFDGASYTANTGRSRGRLIVLAVDRESMAFGEGGGVLKAAGDFLNRLGPDDKVAFLALPQTEPMIDFTLNREVIRQALLRSVGLGQRARRQVSMGVYEAIAIAHRSDPVTEESVMTRLCPAVSRAPRTNPDGRQTADLSRTFQDRCRMEVRAQALGIASEIGERADASLRALRDVLDSLRRIDAPASFIWISDGLVTEAASSDLSDLSRLAGSARATIHVLMVDSTGGNIIESDRSPSARQDRNLERQGLMNLAMSTRGALYNVGANAGGAFERIERELSGYYLLAVETAPGDHDGKRHEIDVKVRRRGAQIRARREFQMRTDTQAAALTPREQLLEVLRSPVNVGDLPLRMATYGYQDAESGRVKLLIAAEVERPGVAGTTPVDMSVGLVVHDEAGQPVTSQAHQVSLAPTTTAAGQTLAYSSAVVVDPGHYTVRVAAVDDKGLRGSVARAVTAYQMADVPFAVSDLMLTDTREAGGGGIRPVVEPRLDDGRLGAYLELYSNEPGFLDDVHVQVEVAHGESSDALVSSDARLVTAEGGGRGLAVAGVPVDVLGPNVYVARAVIRRGDETIGRLDRPFRVTAARPSGRSIPALTSLVETAPFNAAAVLAPQVLGFFLDEAERRYPGMRRDIVQARRGHLDTGARQAFERGDQRGAAFLHGLELLGQGAHNAAALQFAAALSISPDFGPAAFYLGACYAAAGRHADAAIVWRRALLGEEKLAVQYAMLADALIQAGESDQAVVVLRQGLDGWPDDDPMRRRLAVAYGAQSQFQQVLPQIEPYIARHSDDHEALLVALHALFSAHVAGQVLKTEARDRAAARDYARAYVAMAGPHARLVTSWAAVFDTALDRGADGAGDRPPVEP